MTNRPNKEYDSKQSNIQWEDHVGLCGLACKKLIRRNPRLHPFANDIMQDLQVVLWRCANGFDESRGYRFSTYAIRSMILEYRDIVKLYLDNNHHCQSKSVRCVALATKEDGPAIQDTRSEDPVLRACKNEDDHYARMVFENLSEGAQEYITARNVAKRNRVRPVYQAKRAFNCSLPRNPTIYNLRSIHNTLVNRGIVRQMSQEGLSI